MGASSRAVVLQFLGESGQLKATLAGIQKDLAGTEGAVGALAGAGAKLSTLGAALTKYVSLPLALVGAESVKLALNYDSAMNKVAAITTATKGDMDLWYKSVLDLAKTVPLGPDVLAQGLYFVASSGFHGAAAMDILTASAKASTAGLGDVGSVAKTLDSVMNAYKGSTLTATQATDYMIAAISQGDMPAADLANSIGQVLSIASQAGVPFKDLAAAIAASSKQGINAQKTAQGLRFMLSRFISPTAQATKVLEKYGWTVGSLNNELQNKGLLPTLQDLKDKMGTTDFAKVVGGARGLSVALALVGKNGKQVADVFAGVDKAPGSLNKAYATAEQNPEVKLKTQLNALKVAGITLGNDLLPTVVKIADWLAKIADKFSNLSPGVQKFIAQAMVILIVLGPVLKVLGTLFKLLAGGLKIILTVAGWIGKFVEVLGALWDACAPVLAVIGEIVGDLLLAITPIGWVIIAIIALAAAFYLAWRYSGTFRKLVGEALSWVGEQAKIVGEFWAHIGEDIVNGFKAVGSAIYNGLSAAVSAVASVVLTVWKAIEPVAKVIGAILLIPIVIALKLIIWQFNVLATVLRAVVPPIFRLLKSAWDEFYSAISAGIRALVSIWTATWNVISSVFSTVWNVIYGLLKKLVDFYIWEFNLLYSILSTVWSALWGGVVGVWNWVWGVLSAGFNALWGIIYPIWQKISGFVSTMWDGAWTSVSNVWDKIQTLLRGVWANIVSPILTTLGKDISAIGSGLWSGLKDTFLDAINGIIHVWDNFTDHLKIPPQKAFGVTIFPGIDLSGTLHIPDAHFADGGIFDKPTRGVFGEAGAETILPLTRPQRAIDLMQRSGAGALWDSRLGGKQSDRPSVHIENLNVTQQGLSSPDATARAVAWELRRRIA